MATNQGITFAFIVSLVGGLIVFIASLVNVVWFLSGAANFGGFGNYMRGAMDGYHSFMGSYGSSNSFLAGISVVGLVCGVIVLIGAIMLKVEPHQSTYLGNSHHCLFSCQLCWYGRLLHRCNTWHRRRSIRFSHQTNKPISEILKVFCSLSHK